MSPPSPPPGHGPKPPLRTSWPPWAIGVAVAVLVLVPIAIGTAKIPAEAAGDRPIDALGYVAALVAGAVLVARRRWPWVVFAVVAIALAVYTARRYPGGPIYLAGVVSLFSAASAGSRRVGYATAAVTGVALVVLRAFARGGFDLDDLLFLGWPAVAALAADAMRGRRERLAAEEERRRHEEAEREGEARRRLAEDRLRLARDLHDSVAHSLAVVNVQSGVAAHVIDRDPAQAGAALEAIRIASRDVLDELGAMLDVLRDTDRAPRHPTPDLSRLDALVESSRRAGLDVDVVRRGPLDEVPAAIGTAAYRVVQEALTNVVRHAGSPRATVAVTATPGGGVDVEVLDDGRAGGHDDGASADGSGAGVGLVGIRERVAMTGGTSEIGPRPDGGFRVHVAWSGRS